MHATCIQTTKFLFKVCALKPSWFWTLIFGNHNHQSRVHTSQREEQQRFSNLFLEKSVKLLLLLIVVEVIWRFTIGISEYHYLCFFICVLYNYFTWLFDITLRIVHGDRSLIWIERLTSLTEDNKNREHIFYISFWRFVVF